MIDSRIKNVIVFGNGNVAVCDAAGNQMPEYQGSQQHDPGILARVQAACGPDVEWQGPRPLQQASGARAAMLAWARADRDADDRAATLAGVERMIKSAAPPAPGEMLAVRDRAQLALTEACKIEERAEALLKEMARRMLDDPGAPALPEVVPPPTKDEIYAAIKRALARAVRHRPALGLEDAIDELAREAAQAVVILFPRN